MTDWEKLLAGQVYNDFSKELFNRRVRAKKLTRKFNLTEDDEIELRNQIFEELFLKKGTNVWIEPDFRCEFGSNITIGNDVYVNFGCVILDCAEVYIGNNTLIGPNVGLYAVNHGLDPYERSIGACIGKPIIIKDKVWLGGDVKILGGVTIGEGAVIGTGSIVTKDIPSMSIAVGNPCKVIRKITDKDKVGFELNRE